MSRSTFERFYAATDGNNATGTFALQSALGETTLAGASAETYTELDIPKGIRAKVWIQKLTGQIVTVNVFYNANPTGATNVSFTMPTNADVQVGQSFLPSPGTIELDDRRPHYFDGLNPGTAIARLQFKWSQTVAAVSVVVIDIEWCVVDDAGN